jgi:predicted transcriptional regulator
MALRRAPPRRFVYIKERKGYFEALRKIRRLEYEKQKVKVTSLDVIRKYGRENARKILESIRQSNELFPYLTFKKGIIKTTPAGQRLAQVLEEKSDTAKELLKLSGLTWQQVPRLYGLKEEPVKELPPYMERLVKHDLIEETPKGYALTEKGSEIVEAVAYVFQSGRRRRKFEVREKAVDEYLERFMRSVAFLEKVADGKFSLGTVRVDDAMKTRLLKKFEALGGFNPEQILEELGVPVREYNVNEIRRRMDELRDEIEGWKEEDVRKMGPLQKTALVQAIEALGRYKPAGTEHDRKVAEADRFRIFARFSKETPEGRLFGGFFGIRPLLLWSVDSGGRRETKKIELTPEEKNKLLGFVTEKIVDGSTIRKAVDELRKAKRIISRRRPLPEQIVIRGAVEEVLKRGAARSAVVEETEEPKKKPTYRIPRKDIPPESLEKMVRDYTKKKDFLKTVYGLLLLALWHPEVKECASENVRGLIEKYGPAITSLRDTRRHAKPGKIFNKGADRLRRGIVKFGGLALIEALMQRRDVREEMSRMLENLIGHAAEKGKIEAHIHTGADAERINEKVYEEQRKRARAAQDTGSPSLAELAIDPCTLDLTTKQMEAALGENALKIQAYGKTGEFIALKGRPPEGLQMITRTGLKLLEFLSLAGKANRGLGIKELSRLTGCAVTNLGKLHLKPLIEKKLIERRWQSGKYIYMTTEKGERAFFSLLARIRHLDEEAYKASLERELEGLGKPLDVLPKEKQDGREGRRKDERGEKTLQLFREGRTLPEIAEILGVSQLTVRGDLIRQNVQLWLKGMWPTGTKVPILQRIRGGVNTSRDLAEETGVSLQTIHKHLSRLEEEGYIVNRTGARPGVYVLTEKGENSLKEWEKMMKPDEGEETKEAEKPVKSREEAPRPKAQVVPERRVEEKGGSPVAEKETENSKVPAAEPVKEEGEGKPSAVKEAAEEEGGEGEVGDAAARLEKAIKDRRKLSPIQIVLIWEALEESGGVIKPGLTFIPEVDGLVAAGVMQPAGEGGWYELTDAFTKMREFISFPGHRLTVVGRVKGGKTRVAPSRETKREGSQPEEGGAGRVNAQRRWYKRWTETWTEFRPLSRLPPARGRALPGAIGLRVTAGKATRVIPCSREPPGDLQNLHEKALHMAEGFFHAKNAGIQLNLFELGELSGLSRRDIKEYHRSLLKKGLTDFTGEERGRSYYNATEKLMGAFGQLFNVMEDFDRDARIAAGEKRIQKTVIDKRNFERERTSRLAKSLKEKTEGVKSRALRILMAIKLLEESSDRTNGVSRGNVARIIDDITPQEIGGIMANLRADAFIVMSGARAYEITPKGVEYIEHELGRLEEEKRAVEVAKTEAGRFKENQERLLAALFVSGSRGLRQKNLMEIVTSPNAVNIHIGRLIEKGFVEKVGRGRYVITPEGAKHYEKLTGS